MGRVQRSMGRAQRTVSMQPGRPSLGDRLKEAKRSPCSQRTPAWMAHSLPLPLSLPLPVPFPLSNYPSLSLSLSPSLPLTLDLLVDIHRALLPRAAGPQHRVLLQLSVLIQAQPPPQRSALPAHGRAGQRGLQTEQSAVPQAARNISMFPWHVSSAGPSLRAAAAALTQPPGASAPPPRLSAAPRPPPRPCAAPPPPAGAGGERGRRSEKGRRHPFQTLACNIK